MLRPSQTRRLLQTALVVAVVAPPISAAAQTRLEPGETRVETREGSPAKRDGDGAAERDGTEGTSQSPPARPGIEKFENVDVKRARPDALPPPSASETDIPAVIRNGSGNLPAPPSIDRLEETTSHVEKRVYELVSVQPSRGPGEGTPVVRHGHAVYVSGSNGPPILVTTLFWTEKAEKLFIAPAPLSGGGGENGDKPTAERRSVEEMTVDGHGDRWLEAHRDSLIRAHLYRPDKHRNLATVIPAKTAPLNLPETGLELFDLDEASPVRLYGYSPRTKSGLTQTKLLASHPDRDSLVYYLQTPYAMSYGAPVVSTAGELLVLTAFPHPKQPDITLAVPPAPLAAYVDDVLATLKE